MTGERTPWGSMPWEQDEHGNALPHPSIERNKPRFWLNGLPRDAFPWELEADRERRPKLEPTGWVCPTHGDQDVVTVQSNRTKRTYGICGMPPCVEFER
jgi:hypothetical protein